MGLMMNAHIYLIMCHGGRSWGQGMDMVWYHTHLSYDTHCTVPAVPPSACNNPATNLSTGIIIIDILRNLHSMYVLYVPYLPAQTLDKQFVTAHPSNL